MISSKCTEVWLSKWKITGYVGETLLVYFEVIMAQQIYFSENVQEFLVA
jgi:hypothetical protein